MDSLIEFDTLAYARRFREAGVAGPQAEAYAEALRNAVARGLAARARAEASRRDAAEFTDLMARFTAKLVVMRWVIIFLSILMLAMNGRLYGVF